MSQNIINNLNEFNVYVAKKGYKAIRTYVNDSGYYAVVKYASTSTAGFTNILQGGTILRLSLKDVNNEVLLNKI